ncbi:hypothetical protein [Kitasatospora sp. MY 5-36]|uniref:hypothetical protein n=1 Tax=Kitasatospora sp. MY 5-36 TaxID=1678027 RepID=UPI00067147F7|nr:hypothetical protein [Kitasatospora sp. MY 5-36]
MNEYDGELPTRNLVFNTDLDRLLDLDRDDLGVPEQPGLWHRLRADRRPVAQRGLLCPICRDARPDQPEWMYLSFRRGRRIASHHNPHRRAHTAAQDEQREAYQERYARAAESDGHAVEIGAGTADGRRPAVLVTGADGRRFGFEPQLSYVSAQSVRRRNRLAREDGITAVWHTVDPNAPLIDQVHWVRTDNLPARAIREDRDLLLRGGVRTLRLLKCDRVSPRPCQVRGGGGRCGRWHPTWAVLVPRIDDFVRRVAGGVYVPITQRTRNGGPLRFWAPEADRRRFLANGGVLADRTDRPVIPRQRGADHPRVPERRRAPHRPPHRLLLPGDPYDPVGEPLTSDRVIPPVRREICSAGRIPCGAPGARLYPGGWYCDAHRPGAPG